MYRYNRVAKVAAPPFTSTCLLDQVRERIRYLHYSQATEKAYLFWLRAFIRWSGLRHPRDMGKPEVGAFLSMLANERHVSSSIHKACRYRGVKKVVFSSSVGVYTSFEDGPDEDQPLRWQDASPAIAIYGASKVMGEALCKFYHQRYDIHYVAYATR